MDKKMYTHEEELEILEFSKTVTFDYWNVLCTFELGRRIELSFEDTKEVISNGSANMLEFNFIEWANKVENILIKL